MNDLKDLNIERELLPLFDYSLNLFTRRKILEILEKPLPSIMAVTRRQDILKGFAANNKILKDYSYTVLYLNEVYSFLNGDITEDSFRKKIRYRLFTSNQEKRRNVSKLNQLILLFQRLQSKYFTKLDLKRFPEDYGESIKRITEFLANFELYKYGNIVREHRLQDAHVIELTEKISRLRKKNLISSFWEDLFLFEAYLSINIAIQKNNFTFPSFVENGIKLFELYHPLIHNPVKNDFETASNVIVLNGANMSGKSTFLKAVGICFYFGHLGLGIPASFGEIPFCDRFSIQINRSDDMLNGYSHFMTEVMNLKNVVESATKGAHCFAVFDELFSGTSNEDAIDICRTTINGLSKFKNCKHTTKDT